MVMADMMMKLTKFEQATLSPPPLSPFPIASPGPLPQPHLGEANHNPTTFLSITRIPKLESP